MRAVLLGGTGIISSALAPLLEQRDWDVIRVGRTSGDVRCDTDSPEQLEVLFQSVGKIDALTVTIGTSVKGSVSSLPPQAFWDGFGDKVVRQIRILQHSLLALNPGASVTLTSGILGRDPQHGFASAAAANGAISSFVRVAAVELAPDIRVNCVSPHFVTESAAAAHSKLPAHLPQMSAHDTALAYIHAIESDITGEDIDPFKLEGTDFEQ